MRHIPTKPYRLLTTLSAVFLILLTTYSPAPVLAQNNDIQILNINLPWVICPGATFTPAVKVKVNTGQLLQSRGDMLRNLDGNLFGSWPHIAVLGTVDTGQTYTFYFYSDNPMKAPVTEQTYSSQWQVWRNGAWD